MIIALDISKKQKFNALHFLVFVGVGAWLLVFTFLPWVLNWVGRIFWVARGADVLVYTSIIFLLYFVLLLLAKHIENKESFTTLVRELAIDKSEKKEIKGKEVFLIRAYNEGQVLWSVIDAIYNAGYTNVLLVDDGSTDNTKTLIKNYKEKIFYLRHYTNRGAGAALETGFEYIRRYGEVDYIITFDADWQHSLEDLDKFFNAFEKDKALWVIFGSRFIENTNSNVPFIRKITLFLGRIFTYLLSWIYLTDAHNGYRVFKKDTVDTLHLTIDTMAYASELIEELKKNNVKIGEVPVNIHYTKYSLQKWQRSSNAIGIALRFIWNKFFK